jgi:hypothetical protein
VEELNHKGFILTTEFTLFEFSEVLIELAPAFGFHTTSSLDWEGGAPSEMPPFLIIPYHHLFIYFMA